MLKHDLTRPCQYCPFRRGSLRGWLGGATAVEFAQSALGEVGLVCHIDAERTLESVEDDEAIFDSLLDLDVQQCAGAMAFANHCAKVYRNPALEAHRRKVGARAEVMGRHEFLGYHSGAENLILSSTIVGGRTADMPEPYSLREVAEDCEPPVHPQTLKRHIYVTKRLAGYGRLVGRSLVFTQKEHDEIIALVKTFPKGGRPVENVRGVKNRHAEALAMFEKGKTLSEIAEALGYADDSGAKRAIESGKIKRKNKS